MLTENDVRRIVHEELRRIEAHRKNFGTLPPMPAGGATQDARQRLTS